MSIAASRAASAPAVLHGIDWRTYTRLLRVLDGRRFRLTYDRGILQIMSPFWEHERPTRMFGRFIAVLTEEFQLACLEGGSVTLRRRRKQRGLEPDDCYWIASAGRVLGKTHLDLRIDPPPDLAVEVDVTHSSLDRMSIYAALAVPEVWRAASGVLTFNVLDGGSYRVQTHSLAFPQLASADLADFLARRGQFDDTALALQFRAWVRQNFLPGSTAP
jgi:Uma2 family endonuclease